MQKGVSSSHGLGVELRSPCSQLSLGLALLCTSYLLVTGSMVTHLVWQGGSNSLRSVARQGDLPNYFGRYARPSKQVQAPQQDHHVKFLSTVAEKYGVSPSDAKSLARVIVREASSANIDPILVAAVIKKESTFRKHVVSNRGAQGLMQVMPLTGKYISDRFEMAPFDSRKLKDPSTNIRLGVRYLKYLTSKYRNNVEHALIAYNWGPGNLSKALRGEARIPDSTIKYARGVLKAHRNWKADFTSRAG